VNYLKFFSFPSVGHFLPPDIAIVVSTVKDPNEINFDDEEEEAVHFTPHEKEQGNGKKTENDSCSLIQCFEDYGLGKLSCHPIIQVYFPFLSLNPIFSQITVTSSLSSYDSLPSTSDILSFLKDYVMETEAATQKKEETVSTSFSSIRSAPLSFSSSLPPCPVTATMSSSFSLPHFAHYLQTKFPPLPSPSSTAFPCQSLCPLSLHHYGIFLNEHNPYYSFQQMIFDIKYLIRQQNLLKSFNYYDWLKEEFTKMNNFSIVDDDTACYQEKETDEQLQQHYPQGQKKKRKRQVCSELEEGDCNEWEREESEMKKTSDVVSFTSRLLERMKIKLKISSSTASSSSLYHPLVNKVIQDCQEYYSFSSFSLTMNKIEQFLTHRFPTSPYLAASSAALPDGSIFEIQKEGQRSESGTGELKKSQHKRGKRNKIDDSAVTSGGDQYPALSQNNSSIGRSTPLIILEKEKYDTLIEMAKEYLFLAFGKSSKIMKKFDIEFLPFSTSTTTTTASSSTENHVSFNDADDNKEVVVIEEQNESENEDIKVERSNDETETEQDNERNNTSESEELQLSENDNGLIQQVVDSHGDEEDQLEVEEVNKNEALNLNEVKPLSNISGSSTSTNYSMVGDPSLKSPILASLHFSKPPSSLDDSEIIETITNQQIQLLFSFQEFHQLLKESNECYHLQQQQKQQQQRRDINISNPVEPSSTSSSSSSTEADTTPLSHELVGYWGERFVYYYLQKVLPSSTSTSDRQKVNDDGGYCYQDYVIEWNNEKEESLSFYDILIKERQLIVPSAIEQQQQLQQLQQQQQKRRKKQQRSTTSLSWKEKEKSYFIEIKSTQYDLKKNVFNISWNEFQFAFYHHLPSSSASATTTASSTSNTQMFSSHYRKVPYYVFRVFNVFNYFKIEIIILKDIQKLLEKGRIKLCLAV
jgi:hypothetical protein